MGDNKVCLTCGKSYKYCNSCSDSQNRVYWKNVYDCEECKDIFEIVSDYAQNCITKDVARQRLSKYDLSTKVISNSNVKKYLDEIVVETIAVNNKKKSSVINTEDKEIKG